MQRDNLPRPTTDIDTYLHDICLSLRQLVDLATPAAVPAPAAAVTELREPAPRMTTRDALIAAEQNVAQLPTREGQPPTPPTMQATQTAPTGAQPAPAEKPAAAGSRRHPRVN